MQKYSVNQYLIEVILASVKAGEIAIPEIQRPFVWDSSKVRDLMDSLYQGYPIGYVIAWRNPNVKLKDGSLSEGKKVLIDGQQRITALTAAILGQSVVNKNYQHVKIKIAFNPIEERFEVQNPAILKDKTWLPDISDVFSGKISFLKLVRDYLASNTEIDEELIEKSFTNLINIPKKQIGLIELAPELDIETVTEIFIRINSKGVVLSQADFAMSKIASDTENGGNELRKAIDYFCHLAVAPEFYQHILENDKEFAQTEFFRKMSWLKTENDDLYDPTYNDLIRVAFTSQFSRGRLSDLVSLLSGRNFETRTFETEIAEKSFQKLKKGVENFINETNFKRFLMIVKSAGFISPKLIRSQNALNFAYILYLKLKELQVNPVSIESYVKRWLVYSILTGRYSGSPESMFDFDIKQISQKPFEQYLREKEEAELSDAFWNASLPQSLNTSVASSPYFLTFLASQVKANDKGFLSKDISVRELIEHRGDIHHLFPKDYLKKNGLNKGQYNQIANYVYMQSEINIKIGNKSPKDYFELIKQQSISGISNEQEFLENLKVNCIPTEIIQMNIEDYQDFLSLRRKLMAQKIKEYYFSL
ncbi:GmrSD restriction endonuclease domain-containing protein [Capnocytophaga canimorsus]|uniref:GmrSD restriction endonuclease domain-containing protein n=1 Tax=Capnocytophaga canimorsus TaxID=28188 RepID=UPI0037D407BE